MMIKCFARDMHWVLQIIEHLWSFSFHKSMEQSKSTLCVSVSSRVIIVWLCRKIPTTAHCTSDFMLQTYKTSKHLKPQALTKKIFWSGKFLKNWFILRIAVLRLAINIFSRFCHINIDSRELDTMDTSGSYKVTSAVQPVSWASVLLRGVQNIILNLIDLDC